MIKYQGGGNLQSRRAMIAALRNMQQKSKFEGTSTGLFQRQEMGRTKEKMEKEIEEWQEKLEAQSQKGSGFFKKLKILDLIPGGKWLKTGIKAIGTYDQAKQMKDLAKKAGIEGYGEGFLGKSEKDVNKKFRELEKEFADPLEAMLKSVATDVVSNVGKKTFKEAFAGTDVDLADAGKDVGLADAGKDVGTKLPGKSPVDIDLSKAGPEMDIDLSKAGPVMDIPGEQVKWAMPDIGATEKFAMSDIGAAENLGMQGTPWKDTFREQFGFGEGETFKDLFRLGEDENAMDLFNRWGLAEGSGGFLDSPFFHAGEQPVIGGEGEWEDIWSDLMLREQG